ncbi:hypothetical protein ACPYIV_18095 [Parabacteroides sp. ASD2025]|uniref:hypothetical protein n=1 Tax=Parabacteroides sp. ASD2025 TaxID=3415987 RepID=UPI003CEC5557
MMSGDWAEIFQLLVTSGLLGGGVGWLVNRTLRKARTAKEVHDTYKAMYEDMRGTLIELRNDNEKLYSRIGLLENVVHRAPTCRHWSSCPLRPELSRTKKYKGDADGNHPYGGQPRIRNPGYDDGTGGERGSDADDPDGEPP